MNEYGLFYLQPQKAVQQQEQEVREVFITHHFNFNETLIHYVGAPTDINTELLMGACILESLL